MIAATDAPLGSAQLERLARCAGLGLARTGSVAHHGSGEIDGGGDSSIRLAGVKLLTPGADFLHILS